nr:FMN reductase [uncultured Friedmanniella sp.]
MSRPTVVVLTAGLSQPSSTRLLGDRLGAAVQAALAERGNDADLQFVELREHARDLTNHLLTGFASGDLAEAIGRVQRADALVVVTPIFSASYSGLFKMFFDVLPAESLVGKSTLIAATAGTARHSLALEHALRPLFAYLRAVVVPTAVFAATEDWADGGALDERIRRAAGELADLLRSRSGAHHERGATPELEVTPFSRLLARGRA